MDGSEVQVRGQPACTIQIGPVALGRVAGNVLLPKRLPRLVGRSFARGGWGQMVVRSRWQGIAADVRQPGDRARLIAGSRHPCARHALANGVNTRSGSPSGLRTRPGVTADADPVLTGSVPARAAVTAWSRWRPYGPVPWAMCTLVARSSTTSSGSTVVGSPRRTTRWPSIASFNSVRQPIRNLLRGTPEGFQSAGSTEDGNNVPIVSRIPGREQRWVVRGGQSRRNHMIATSATPRPYEERPGGAAPAPWLGLAQSRTAAFRLADRPTERAQSAGMAIGMATATPRKSTVSPLESVLTPPKFNVPSVKVAGTSK